MRTSGLRAMPAFRILVSMSLIGSLTLIVVLPASRSAGYQLDLVTPGNCPCDAISRKQIRQVPNLRI
jgi:hypothetical protein